MAVQQKKTGQNGGRTAGKNTGKNPGRSTGKSTGSTGRGRSSGRSGSRSSGTGRSASGRGGRGGGQNDRLSSILLAVLLVVIVVLALAFALKKRGQEDEKETPTPTFAIQPSTPEPTPTEQAGETITPEPTSAGPAVPTGAGVPEGPTPEPAPTGQEPEDTTPVPTLTPEPTPTKAAEPAEPEVSLQEAERLIEDAFWESGENYRFELSDSSMELDGATYYRYRIYYRNKAEDYALLVDRASGALYYYENGERTEFDGGRHEPDEDGAMTEEKAAELLADIPPASLMLPAPLGECRLSLDKWKTVVAGVDCYCLNVFHQDTLAGSIYFTETADTVYYLDEFGEFVRVR